ncbi:aldo/keto reductase [Sphingosinicella sp. LHD-64]|uniref:aldo/keto reductase n=1 Tax=Sphingosinicella sp. LHD-64 TaxID=3072139 RepID=UPI00280F57CB|nr:aldo/keto reductase [Sphingosinicella sp. LHD-64]MDQ8755914.1 aldo/keto reductase [Sphingosinicella sp. LHD-64]
MIDRRSLLAGLASLPFAASAACAQSSGQPPAPATGGALRTVRIPGADVEVPIVGVGTARRYDDPQGAEALAPLRDTIRRFAELGGQVIDTAPSYGRAEEVVGQLVEELGVRDRLFLATKVGVDTREEGVAQIEESFRKLRTARIDLIAVHNLRDVDNQLAILRDLKSAGRIRALGITTSSDRQYEQFEAVMRREALDTIQVDYALDNRNAAERILPLAQERGFAVFINLPFGRDRLFGATRDRPLPDWAAEIGATSWAQVFLKYVLSHPCRPIAIPGMAQVRYVEDNLGAARAPLPDAAMRTRMEQFIDGL